MQVMAVPRRVLEEEELKPYQVELLKLQRYLEEENRRMIVLFEGRDAAGKGGTIRRVTRYMNEKHYRVVALGRPTEEQRTQWYFQRYVAQFPSGGEIVLFDRSWYNRAMVEPVFGFCTDEEYRNFLKGVVGFEKDLVRQGTIMVKLYFSVTKEEQARRFERRRDDPLRQWKLSEIDVQAQEHWDDFTDAKYQMLRRTSTADAPWTIVRSEDKHKARLNAIRVMLNAVAVRRPLRRRRLRARPRDRHPRRAGAGADGGRPHPQRQVHRVRVRWAKVCPQTRFHPHAGFGGPFLSVPRRNVSNMSPRGVVSIRVALEALDAAIELLGAADSAGAAGAGSVRRGRSVGDRRCAVRSRSPASRSASSTSMRAARRWTSCWPTCCGSAAVRPSAGCVTPSNSDRAPR